jgi:hypothetical protein
MRLPPILRLPRIPFARAAVAGASALLLSGCGGSSSASPPTRTAPLVSIFEAGPQLRTDPAQTLSELRKLGVDYVKVFVPWAAVAPAPTSRTQPAGFKAGDPAAYPLANWAPYDTIIKDAEARGIGVDLTLSGPPPEWAAGAGAPPGIHPQWKPRAADYGQFVDAVGVRYSGHYTPPGVSAPLPRVSFWSIWNEPNYGPDLAPQATDHTLVEVSPRSYRRLLNAAWTALHVSGHGNDTILIGELAPRGQTQGNHPGDFDGMVPLRFIRALYCVDGSFKPLGGNAASVRGCPATTAATRAFRRRNPALFEASGFADHPYPQGQTPPTFVTPDEPGYADFATLDRLILTLDRAQQAYGASTGLAIWSTEFGYKTDPPLADMATPSAAAGLMNWSEYLTWRNPRLRSYDQYELEDPPGNGPSNFVTGLEFASGLRKATYAAYRMPLWLPKTRFSSGQSLELWGCVRPARSAREQTGRVQRVRIQFRPIGASRFATVATIRLGDAYGYFDVDQAFRGTGSVRLAWRYPGGRRIFSRTVALTRQ